MDLVYYGNQGQLEYDFVVQPGADPRQIALALDNAVAPLGARPVRERRTAGDTPALQIGPNGDLVVGTVGGELSSTSLSSISRTTMATKRQSASMGGMFCVLRNRQSTIGNRNLLRVRAYDIPGRSSSIQRWLTPPTWEERDRRQLRHSGRSLWQRLCHRRDLFLRIPHHPGAFQTTFGGCHEWAPPMPLSPS